MEASPRIFLKQHSLTLFILLTVLISWFPWYTGGSGFFVFGPSIAGVIVVALTMGKAGMQDLGQRALRWRVGWRWWMVALFFSGILLTIAIGINLMMGGAMPSFAFFREGWYWAPVYFLLTLIGGPLGEEFGWRGFALPNLQRKWNPTLAGIIIGTLWGLWHLPLFFQAGSLHAEIGLQLLPVYVIGEIALAVIMTWVYNSTGGSLLVGGIILHNADNFWASTLITDETFQAAFQGGVQSQFDMQLYLVGIAVSVVAIIVIAWATKGQLGFSGTQKGKI